MITRLIFLRCIWDNYFVQELIFQHQFKSILLLNIVAAELQGIGEAIHWR